jgi:hypothetical protein
VIALMLSHPLLTIAWWFLLAAWAFSEYEKREGMK